MIQKTFESVDARVLAVENQEVKLNSIAGTKAAELQKGEGLDPAILMAMEHPVFKSVSKEEKHTATIKKRGGGNYSGDKFSSAKKSRAKVKFT